MIKSGSSEEMAKAPLLNASRLEAGAKAGGDGESMAKKVVLAYTCMAVWIGLSAAVIMLNKYILAYGGFPYPITLTMGHMLFCATMAIAAVRLGWVESPGIDQNTYLRAIVPIGICYALTLWVGNAAYLYLSVAFIQMLKALSPVAVFLIGCVFGTEKFGWPVMASLVVITMGVVIASAGEISFNLLGVFLQLASIVTESTRLVVVQKLLQSRGLKLNPITTLYYVAPCCFVALLPPWLLLEAGKLLREPQFPVSIHLFLASAVVAFGLNLAVFLLIGRTSALTARVGGVVKDILLIGISVYLFDTAITTLTVVGYGIALAAIGWYNFLKLTETLAESKPLEPVKSQKELGEQHQELISAEPTTPGRSTVQRK